MKTPIVFIRLRLDDIRQPFFDVTLFVFASLEAAVFKLFFQLLDFLAVEHFLLLLLRFILDDDLAYFLLDLLFHFLIDKLL